MRWRTPRARRALRDSRATAASCCVIARDAFARVPQHRWPHAPRGTLRVRLEHLHDGGAAGHPGLPPKPVLSSGAGLLCGHVDAQQLRHRRSARRQRAGAGRRCAAASSPPGALRTHRIRRRSRWRRACRNWCRCMPAASARRGAASCCSERSGSGKSTLALHAALAGLDFLAEDSVFVQPATLHATGLSAYMHARDRIHCICWKATCGVPRAPSPRIQRRSGVRKHEIDLRARPRAARGAAIAHRGDRRARGATRTRCAAPDAAHRRAAEARVARGAAICARNGRAGRSSSGALLQRRRFQPAARLAAARCRGAARAAGETAAMSLATHARPARRVDLRRDAGRMRAGHRAALGSARRHRAALAEGVSRANRAPMWRPACCGACRWLGATLPTGSA